MCYKVIERYSVCKCIYFTHAVDPCGSYGQYGHEVTEKTVLVGYACPNHSAPSLSALRGARLPAGNAGLKTDRALDLGYGLNLL